MNKKKCTICKKTRVINRFHRDSSRPDGFSSRCSPCNSNKQADYKRRLKSLDIKFCYKCKEEKKIGEFYKDKTRGWGVTDDCKACRRQTTKARYYRGMTIPLGNEKWKSLDGPIKRLCDCHEKSYVYQRANPCQHKLDI